MLEWIIFGITIFVSFVVDVGMCSGKNESMSIRQALVLSLCWILLALCYNATLLLRFDSEVALQFLASYLLEKGLSVDNVFAFYVIFENFKIPERHQRRVLQWGIIGALMMRATFIATGIQLLERFHFIIFVFGALLILTGIKLMKDSDGGDEKENFHDKWYIKLVQKCIPYVDDKGPEGAFFVNLPSAQNPQKIRIHATRLFFALISVEIMDAVFALDSIPAILSLTNDPLVVYTSNIFAILGLRALYFAISGMVHQFHYLKYGLAVILIFVGFKMLISQYYKIPLVAALLFIVAVMALSIIASSFRKRDKEKCEEINSVVVNT